MRLAMSCDLPQWHCWSDLEKTSFLPKKKAIAADGRIKLSAAKIAIALLSEQINLPSGNLLHNYT